MFKGLTGLLKSRLPESVPDSGSLDASAQWLSISWDL